MYLACETGPWDGTVWDLCGALARWTFKKAFASEALLDCVLTNSELFG